MHRGKMIVGGHRLNERVMLAVLSPDRDGQALKRGHTVRATFATAMSRRPEDHVCFGTTRHVRRTVIIIGTSDDSTVDV